MAYYDDRQQYVGPPPNSRSQGYGGQGGYDLQPQRSRDPTVSQRNSAGAYRDDQIEDPHRNNQQYSDRHAASQQQHFSNRQRVQTAGPEGPIPNENYGHPQSDRMYQYDERYRDNTRGVAQRGGREQFAGRRSPPQLRPGTSASDKRLKNRILDSTNESPKAMAWDNPFGVFPGTKKDVEERKKKHDGEERERSKAGTPSSLQPPQSPRRPTTADADASRTTAPINYEKQRPSTSHARKPLPPGARFPPQSPYEKSFGEVSSGRPVFQEQAQQGSWHPVESRATPQNGNGMLSLPERPAAHRSASGPNSRRQPMMEDEPMLQARNQGRDQNRRIFSEGMEQNRSQQQRDDQYAPPNMNGETQRNDFSNHALRSPTLDAGPTRQQYPRDDSGQDMKSSNGYGQSGYHGMAPAGSDNAFENHDMPDFANTTPTNSTSIKREAPQQIPAPYHKPTFGQVSSKPVPNIQTPTEDSVTSAYSDRTMWSPAHDGEYEIQTFRTRSRDAPPQAGIESPYDGQNQYQQAPRRTMKEQYSDGRPNANRIDRQNDMMNARPPNKFSHPYNQPPVGQQRIQPGHPAPRQRPPREQQPMSPQYAARQDYGFDDRGYPVNHSSNQDYHPQDGGNDDNFSRQGQFQEPPTIQRTHTAPTDEYQHDQYNHGYRQDPPRNGQPDRGDKIYQPSSQPYPPSQAPFQEGGQSYNQNRYDNPPRPRTANSARTPLRQNHEEMPIPTQPQTGFPGSDRAHPVPVRPGLMIPTPSPAPIPMPVARVNEPAVPPNPMVQSSQNLPQTSNPRGSPTVTIKELNELREAFKPRPNDAQLGLKFAKKLVEAARVLSSEGGRADPKQTAKNRERYINDAHKIVKKLVAGGSPEAMFYLADCFGQGQLGLEVDAKEAFNLYTSAAKIGHAQSAYRVAVCCEIGHQEGGGTRRDHVKAVQFYKRAATLGDPPAMYKMGMVLLKGLLGQQANPREGISWLKRAAERADEENPHALHELGLLYESAKPTDVILRDEAYALQLFNSAAKFGYKYSQHRLGSAYEYGTLGCPIDPRQSIHWYSEAAKQQEHQSEFALSGWYLTGSPPLLEQSDTEAYLWARKAATSGLGKAEYAMGYYSEVGIGVNADVEEAKKWYFRAAAQGDMRARERLEELKRGAGRRKRDRVSRSDVTRKNEGECTVM